MWLFLTIVLLVSIAGMLAILTLKRYELNTGSVLLSGLRPGLRSFFAHGLFWIEHVMPALAAALVRRAWATVRVAARAGAARSIIAIEHGLEQVLQTLRHTSSPTGGEASPFLREVAEHKKKLQEDREE